MTYDDSYIHLCSWLCPGSSYCTDMYFPEESDIMCPKTAAVDFEAHAPLENRKFSPGTICAICSNSIFSGAYVLGCSHTFHKKCLYYWIFNKWRLMSRLCMMCPMCFKWLDLMGLEILVDHVRGRGPDPVDLALIPYINWKMNIYNKIILYPMIYPSLHLPHM